MVGVDIDLVYGKVVMIFIKGFCFVRAMHGKGM